MSAQGHDESRSATSDPTDIEKSNFFDAGAFSFHNDELFFNSGDLAGSMHDIVLPDAELLAAEMMSTLENHYQMNAGQSPSAAALTELTQSPGRLAGTITSPPGSDSSHQGQLTTVGSLEFLADSFSFYIGPTGVSDVHLLGRESFGRSGMTKPKVSGLKYRMLETGQVARSGSVQLPIIFGITDRALIEKTEPRVDTEAVEHAWSELWKLLTPTSAWHLVQLYSRFVDPYFPILCRHQIPSSPDELSNMPLALLAAICATALPFIMYDERLVPLLLRPPSTQVLYRLCWLGIWQELHAPSLSTLQACLLFQQRLPTNQYLSDTAFAWSIMSTAVAVGQTVGLHRDPSAWSSVPLWERKMRRRLWWSLWAMEKWIALARGMPSHIHDDDYDVSQLTSADFEDTLSVSNQTNDHIRHLVSLTGVLADIQKTYYSTRGISTTANDLQFSLDAARSIRVRLKEWRDDLPQSLRFDAHRARPDSFPTHRNQREPELDGNASVHLSYVVAHMSLFRALLRPLQTWSSTVSSEEAGPMFDRAQAVVRGALVCVKEFVEFVETLTGVQWNAFWHSWSRACFAIAGSFMVHLLHIVSAWRFETPSGQGFEEEYGELQDYIKRWRWANRMSTSGAAGMKGLTNLGLLRVETLLDNLGGRD